MGAKTTRTVQLHLIVDFDHDSMTKYLGIRQTDAQTQAMQAAQDYLYQAVHGWQGSTGETKYLTLESGPAFQPTLDTVASTDLPVWSEVPAAMNGGLEAYNALEFGLTFKPIDARKEPSCVKYVRKGKKVYVEYNYDLEVDTGFSTTAKTNWIPFVTGGGVHPDLQALATADITLRHRMIMLVERDMKP